MVRARRPIFAGLGATATDPTSAILTSLCPSGVGKGGCAFESNAAPRVAALEAFLQTAIQTRFIPDPAQTSVAQAILEADASTNCSSYANQPSHTLATTSSIIGTAGGLTATAAIAAGAAAGSVVPVVGTIVGAIAGIIGALFSGHHAKAVAGEQADICSVIPSANQALAQIDAGLASGQVTPAQASSLYSQLQSQFTAGLKRNTTYKTGDALWAFNLAMQAVLQARARDLQAGVGTGGNPLPSGTAPAAGTISATLTANPLLWLALGAAAIFLL